MGTGRAATTRESILEQAMDLASVEGLAGLTLGRLAERVGMSKSGVIGHFASKQALQQGAVEAAARDFEARVVAPVLAAAQPEPGLARLRALLDGWLDYIESGRFEGGCFFAAASAEFDGRPGSVRDRVAALTRGWLELLRAEARLAQRLGEISETADPEQIAFECHAFVHEANWARQLLGREDAFERARAAVGNCLARAAAS